MIVGLYQTTSPAGDLSAALAALDQALGAAARAGAEMLVMPEVFLPGYNSAAATPPPGYAEALASLPDLCARHGVGLTIGLAEYSGDQVFNTAIAFDAAGAELARYRKIQLFGPAEAALYTPGDRYVTFRWRGVTFGLLICYDVEFPEHTRALARVGAEVILVPTANMAPFVNVNQILVPARAAESALTIVYANYCGSEGALDYVGLSAILGPDGYQIGSKGQDAGLCIARLPGGPDDWSEHDIPLATQLKDLKELS